MKAATPKERPQVPADAQLLDLIVDRNLLVNANQFFITVYDQTGRSWKGADLRELLRQIN